MICLFSFSDWWEALNSAQQVFWAIGGISSALYILQTIISFLGADVDTDIDTDAGEFGVFSFKSIMAFLIFFGWTGVLMLGNGQSLTIAVLMALGAGLVSMFVVAYMLYQFRKIETSGTMKYEMALLQEGTVYLTIPEQQQGKGKVHLNVNGNLRELVAATEGDQIPNGAPVKVVEILEDNTLLVEPIELLEAPDESLNQL